LYIISIFLVFLTILFISSILHLIIIIIIIIFYYYIKFYLKLYMCFLLASEINLITYVNLHTTHVCRYAESNEKYTGKFLSVQALTNI